MQKHKIVLRAAGTPQPVRAKAWAVGGRGPVTLRIVDQQLLLLQDGFDGLQEDFVFAPSEVIKPMKDVCCKPFWPELWHMFLP